MGSLEARSHSRSTSTHSRGVRDVTKPSAHISTFAPIACCLANWSLPSFSHTVTPSSLQVVKSSRGIRIRAARDRRRQVTGGSARRGKLLMGDTLTCRDRPRQSNLRKTSPVVVMFLFWFEHTRSRSGGGGGGGVIFS